MTQRLSVRWCRRSWIWSWRWVFFDRTPVCSMFYVLCSMFHRVPPCSTMFYCVAGGLWLGADVGSGFVSGWTVQRSFPRRRPARGDHWGVSVTAGPGFSHISLNLILNPLCNHFNIYEELKANITHKSVISFCWLSSRRYEVLMKCFWHMKSCSLLNFSSDLLKV